MKLIKLPQQINDRFDINDKPWKFCSSSFLMFKFIVYSLLSTYKDNKKQFFVF